MRWLRALVPYALILAIGGPIALALRTYYAERAAVAALTWAHPDVWVLAGAGLLLAWVGFHLARGRGATMAFSRVGELRRAGGGFRSYLVGAPMALRIVALGALIVALARPQTYRTITREVDSVDIMIVLDLSQSMEETDMARGEPLTKTDRLDAAQRVIRRFVAKRQGDRVGVVVFAQQAMLQCPLTHDSKMLEQIVADLTIGDVPELGTAIGDGLALAVAQLRRSDAKSKVVILLSDGDSNWTTRFEPDEAARAAAEMGVKVYTVLVGHEGGDFLGFGGSVNPATMREIARVTGGEFFRATDYTSFDRGFQAVRNKLDKTKRVSEEKVPGKQLFVPFALLAALLLALDLLLAHTWLRRLP